MSVEINKLKKRSVVGVWKCVNLFGMIALAVLNWNDDSLDSHLFRLCMRIEQNNSLPPSRDEK